MTGPLSFHRTGETIMMLDTLTRIETPHLRSPRLVLRAPRMSDTGALALYAGDQRVANMTTAIPHPYPPGAAEAYVEAIEADRSPETVWAIDATPDGGSELVGVISVKRAAGEIGYWVGPPFWGTGYASEAALMVCRYLLVDCSLPKVTAHVLFDNPASQRVLRRVGFRQTGETWLYSVAREMEVPAISFELTPDVFASET